MKNLTRLFIAVLTLVAITGFRPLNAMDSFLDHYYEGFKHQTSPFQGNRDGNTTFMFSSIYNDFEAVKHVLDRYKNDIIKLLQVKNYHQRTVFHLLVISDPEVRSLFPKAEEMVELILNAISKYTCRINGPKRYQEALSLITEKDWKGLKAYDRAKEHGLDKLAQILQDHENYYSKMVQEWSKILWAEQEFDGRPELVNMCLTNQVESVESILQSADKSLIKLLSIQDDMHRTVLHWMVVKVAAHHGPGRQVRDFVEGFRSQDYVGPCYRLMSMERIGKHDCGERLYLKPKDVWLVEDNSKNAKATHFLFSNKKGAHYCGSALVITILKALSDYVYYNQDCPERYKEVLEFLSIKDRDGQTALDLAKDKENKKDLHIPKDKENMLDEIARILEMHEKRYRKLLLKKRM